MDDKLARVSDPLFEASSRVPGLYFKLPVVGQEGPAYRERVYCYELYHQWRCLWPEKSDFALCGEVDKSGHPVVRNRPKPDFLVHWPGQTENLLVVEVKPANASRRKMLKDLRTLTYFRRGLGVEVYHAAYFWLYGVSLQSWQKVGAELTGCARADPAIDLEAIMPVLHEAPGIRATRVTWPGGGPTSG